MNHCIICGRHVNAGRLHYRSTRNTRCEKCLTAERLRDWRYVSPAMKRWRKTREAR